MLHSKSVDTVKSLLSWHECDPRYSTPEARKRVAALYLPVLSVAMDVLPYLYYWNVDGSDRYNTDKENSPPNINQTVAMAISGNLAPTTCETYSSVTKLKKC